jgi:hypothetical protein
MRLLFYIFIFFYQRVRERILHIHQFRLKKVHFHTYFFHVNIYALLKESKKKLKKLK